MAGRRDSFVLQAHLCTIWKDGQYERTRDIGEVRQSFEDQLARLGTSWVDIAMIHYVDSVSDWNAVESGEVPMATLKEAVVRVLAAKYALGIV